MNIAVIGGGMMGLTLAYRLSQQGHKVTVFESNNQQGTVAFKGVLKNGGLGIYIGANPETHKVIALGDSLFGSTVTDLYFSNRGLNDQKQFAFYAKLADGRTGIFRADWDDQ